MNKKIIILVVVIVVILVGLGGVGGYYFWQQKQELSPEQKELELKKKVVTNYQDKHPDYIHLKEAEEGKVILEDIKDKIKFEVPEGWKVGLPSETGGDRIMLFSDKSTILEYMAPGFQETFVCKMDILSTPSDITLEELQKSVEEEMQDIIKEGRSTIQFSEQSVVKVDNFDALLQRRKTEEWGYTESVLIPTGEYLHSFIIFASGGDEYKDYCSQKLDEILKTVSIQ